MADEERMNSTDGLGHLQFRTEDDVGEVDEASGDSLASFLFTYCTRTLGMNYPPTPEGIQAFAWNELDFRYFGSGEYLFPPQPTDENMQTLIIPAKDFLERFNLTIITAVLNIIFSHVGYGWLDETPTFYVMMYTSPKMVYSLMRGLQGAPQPRPGIAYSMLKQGFGELFTRMASKIPNIHFTINISRIVRKNKNSKGVTITWSSPSVTVRRQKFDFLIITSRFPESLDMLDARDDEIDILNRFTNSFCFPALLNLTGMEDKSGLIFSLGAMKSYKPDELIAVRNDVKVLYDFLTPTPDASDIRTSFGNMGESSFIDPTATKANVGYPWKLRALQGKYNTWYTGSFASFETISAVLDYNYLLINEELCV
eukprot:gene32185-16726_t